MPAKVSARDGMQVLSLNGDGNPPFTNGADNEPQRATFGAAITNITPAATPTDFLTIAGAAGKIIRVKSLMLAGVATSASNILIDLIRRSAANTGGTTVPITGRSHDTADGAASAVLAYYTANPSGLGTAVGTLHSARLNLAPAANGSIDRLQWQFTWVNDKAIVLRRATDILAINLKGAAWPAGGALDIDLEWTEE